MNPVGLFGIIFAESAMVVAVGILLFFAARWLHRRCTHIALGWIQRFCSRFRRVILGGLIATLILSTGLFVTILIVKHREHAETENKADETARKFSEYQKTHPKADLFDFILESEFGKQYESKQSQNRTIYFEGRPIQIPNDFTYEDVRRALAIKPHLKEPDQ